MMQITTSHQAPTPLEANSIAESSMQSNRPATEAVLEMLASELKKNREESLSNISSLAAEMTGKGMNLNVMA